MTVTEEVPPRDPAEVTSVPALTVVAPLKVFVPERVAVPSVVLLRAAAPARLAEAVPARTSKDEPVNVPFSIEPPVSVTAATVSAKPPRSKVPPVTVTLPESARRFAAPRRRVPSLSVVPPV